MVYYQRYKSPIGRLYLIADESALCAVLFEKNWNSYKKKCARVEERETALLRQTKKQLAEYFNGKRRSFDLPFRANGTAFQNQVWAELTRMPFGQPRNYKDQAKKRRRPKAALEAGKGGPFSIRARGQRPMSYGDETKGKRAPLSLERQRVLGAIAEQKARNSGR